MNAVAFLDTAAFLAGQHSPTDPGAPASPELVLKLSIVRDKCFRPGLSAKSLTGDDLADFDAQSHSARAAWLYPDLPGRDGKPMKEIMFADTRDYLLATLKPKIESSPAPSIFDTVESLI